MIDIKSTALKTIVLTDEAITEVKDRDAYISSSGTAHTDNCSVVTRMHSGGGMNRMAARKPVAMATALLGIEKGTYAACSACAKVAASKAAEYAANEELLAQHEATLATVEADVAMETEMDGDSVTPEEAPKTTRRAKGEQVENYKIFSNRASWTATTWNGVLKAVAEALPFDPYQTGEYATDVWVELENGERRWVKSADAENLIDDSFAGLVAAFEASRPKATPTSAARLEPSLRRALSGLAQGPVGAWAQALEARGVLGMASVELKQRGFAAYAQIACGEHKGETCLAAAKGAETRRSIHMIITKAGREALAAAPADSPSDSEGPKQRSERTPRAPKGPNPKADAALAFLKENAGQALSVKQIEDGCDFPMKTLAGVLAKMAETVPGVARATTEAGRKGFIYNAS